MSGSISKQYKIALVHDWLTGMRGGEKVLEALCEIYPDAHLFTLLHNPGSVSPLIENRPVFTSFIDRLPLKSKRYRHYLPLFPTAIELFNFKEYDIILSTSHCVAKGVRTPPDTLHISYLHTPMRYVWDMYEEYFSPEKIGRLSAKLIPPIANYLRMWDVTSANRVDYFIANSRHVAKRIRKYYRRDATVIPPPVDTDKFTLATTSEDFYLMITALVPYKRVDLAIEAFNRLGKPLYIIGSGPEKARLEKLSAANVRFFDWVSDEMLRRYARECKALIFPGEEDFGIVPVELQSCGKPVIAFARGGALETVIGYDGSNSDQCTGVFFHEPTVDALIDAVKQFEQLSFDPKVIRAHAQQFGKNHFKTRISAFIEQCIHNFFEKR
jgi:glycosyltransferase involved in cell wall biosynthesis